MTFITPEQELWKAVVYQAFADAIKEVTRGPIPRKTHETLENYRLRSESHAKKMRCSKVERNQAREWLLGAGDDMKMVCQFAGYDPDIIKDKARQLQDGGWSSAIPMGWKSAA